MKISQIHQATEFGAAPPPEVAAKLAAQKEGQDFPPVVATMPATDRQRTIALGVVILLIVAAAIVTPFARMQVTRIDAFIPVVQTTTSAADLITAVLLFAQFSIQPQFALLALACAYIFSGSFAFLQTLAFPGAYAPGGLIGDQFNTPGWLFVLWHITFPTMVLVYALSKDANRIAVLPGKSTGTTIKITVACVVVVVALLTFIATTGVHLLPSLYTTNDTVQTSFANKINFALALWVGTALVVLASRRRTILDLWLVVALLSWLPNFLVAAIASSVRFSMGWYAARCFVLIGSCMLLAVLLTETTVLYSRLANALILQRRERTNRLLSVDAVTAAISHELRTPLAAIALNASTALSQLRSNSLELEEMDSILSDIEADSLRAGSIISSIRELSKHAAVRRALTSVADVVRIALKLMQHDLQINEVSVETEFPDNLPKVHLDGTQLQQVLLNLVKNAIDAMRVVPPQARRLRLSGGLDGHSTVLLHVQDSGPGIPAEDQSRIFEPFFTTKSSGMGLGLAICSTVIENHGGKLRLVKSDDTGSIFEVAIPVQAK